ncbi:hypothetical protein GIB67_021284 [Kingdonia uniflora]|uniref:Uncharacterized protein n=1 Tax=Kingdonia uniflora TaxID=39325 RepID=A0A7J7LFY1_9MAGN|nr:hypothetical protein GIB67_021284 [Kingdonia uniflora]
MIKITIHERQRDKPLSIACILRKFSEYARPLPIKANKKVPKWFQTIPLILLVLFELPQRLRMLNLINMFSTAPTVAEVESPEVEIEVRNKGDLIMKFHHLSTSIAVLPSLLKNQTS